MAKFLLSAHCAQLSALYALYWSSYTILNKGSVDHSKIVLPVIN